MLGAVSSDEPIFLVSMCGTPEEFLAAFRRYVDRHGLFIPTATPAPALHNGRFAITLVDGSVMIEGEAEVASSSPRPSALYGRTGMTLHFTGVDEASKQALAALDKAKLSIKVTSQAAALVPRPSRLTAPVQHPPARAAGAGADKTLALAECVVVGDLAALNPGRAGARTTTKQGAKFAIPPIGPTGSAAAIASSGAQTKSMVQEEAHVSTQTGVPPGPGATPTASTAPINAASAAAAAPPINTASAASSGSVSSRSPALAMDDGPSEATEVGPIVEEAIMQPSGPTLTTTAVIVSAPPSPEALAAAAMSGAKVPLDEELETTMGGPPPMPPSTPAAPAPVARQPSAPVRPPLGAAAARPATIGMYSFTKPGAASGAASEPTAGARPSTAPLTSGATTGATGAIRPSVPAIAPLPGRASAPAIPAPPSSLSGPATRPSSHSLKNGNGTLSNPVLNPLGGPASGPIASSSAAAASSPVAANAAAPSGPTQRPSAHVIRNGVAANATGQTPALRPSVPAIAPVPPAAPRAVPAQPLASLAAPAAAPPAAQKLDGAAPERAERSEPPERSGRVVERGERVTSSQSRRTVLGIAATHVEPAPATPPPRPEDAAAVPEAVHDSMFVETPDPEPDVVEAIPHPSDQLATRREGMPRPPSRPSAAASPPPARRAALDSAFDDSDARARADSASEAMSAGMNGGATADGSMSGRPPLPSFAKPGRVPTSQVPSVPGRPPSAPGRFGRASESVPAAPPQPDLDEAWGEAPVAAPRLVATPPSQPTVPIRPPIAPGNPPGNGRMGTAARPGSHLAGAAVSGAAAPGGSLAAALATPAAAPSPVDEAFATVPTSAPSASSSGLRPLGGLSARPASERSGPLASVSSTSSPVRPLTGGPHLSALDAEVTESIDTDDPNDPVFGAAIGPPSLVPARPALGVAAASAIHQFSDTASVSEPLEAVSASRPHIPFVPPTATGSSSALAQVDGAPAAAAPALEAPPDEDDDDLLSADDDDDDQDVDVDLDGAPADEPPAAGKREESAGHARARQLAIDAKVEIDPALYAESAIDQSFEANFVLPGGEPPPPNWQPPPPQWDPASAGIAMPPPPDQQHNYGYQQPESNYPPGYDMAYPQHLHTGDETALVMAPDVGRRRSLVIIVSTILVLLAGAGVYFFLGAKHKGGQQPAATQPLSSVKADAQEGATPDGRDAQAGSDERDVRGDNAGPGRPDGENGKGKAAAAATGDEPGGDVAAAAAKDCKLLLESTPDGATVLAAGEKLGTTPFTATLPCKQVTLTFRKEGYAEVTQEHTPTAKGEPFSVTLEPAAAIAEKPKLVDLEITANPSNAQIKVGDQELKRGQRKISVPAGVEVTVTISKGGKSASKTLTPTAANRKVSLVIKRGGGRPRKAPSGGQPANSLEDL